MSRLVMILVAILSIASGVFIFLSNRKFGDLPQSVNKFVGVMGCVLGIILFIVSIFFVQ